MGKDLGNIPEDAALSYRMQEHIFTGPDGRNAVSLRFVFSFAGTDAPEQSAVPAITNTTEQSAVPAITNTTKQSDVPSGLIAQKQKTVPAGTSVGTFLRDCLHFSKRQISSLKFREDGIRVNGQMQRVSFILQPGDILEIVPKSAGSLYLDHGTFTQPPDILYEDSELMIVNKPSGMVCHPSPGHYADTLANQAAAYCARKNENWTIRLIGRLDKDTSGIVIFAKNSECAARLSAPASIQKEYFAVACGTLPPSGSICLPIAPDDSVPGKMKTDPFGKPAETHYETIKTFDGHSLLKIRLVHGRTHQIRLHLASIGHPLEGDAMYGNGIKGKTHALLHCRNVRLIHPFTEKELCITAPFPDDWPV